MSYSPRGPLLSHVAIDPETGCWQWTASIRSDGYGEVKFRGHTRLVHHAAYELLVGPIPDDGLVFDHLCRNRACCNPEHLERVTQGENLARGHHANRAKTHCPQGHEYTPENTGRASGGARRCLTCKRLDSRRRRAARKAAA